MSHLTKAIRVAFYHAFLPVFITAVVCVWWFIPGRDSAPLLTAMAILLVANLLVYALESATPDIANWQATSADRKLDAFFVATRVVLWGPVFQVLALLAVLPLIDALSIPSIWPSDWPIAARIALALGAAEVVAYGIHFALHRSPRLWRFHATHHVQTKLNSARWSALHPIEIGIVQLPIFVIAAVLGPAEIDIAGAIVVGRCTTLIAHSNLRLSPSGFGWVFTTPESHRVHHRRGTPANANYADVLIIFDRLVRSFSGATTRDVGVGAGRELSLREQLMLPYNMDRLTDGDERNGPDPAPTDYVIDLRGPAATVHRRPRTANQRTRRAKKHMRRA